MSILIKGMEIPKDCQICRTARLDRLIDCEEFERLSIAHRMYKRSDTCPLIEIPTPHGRLIDADILLQEHERVVYAWGEAHIVSAQAIRTAPTIIDAEEGEHGEEKR